MLSGFLNPISPGLIIILPLLVLPLKIISYRREKLRNSLALIVPIITALFIIRYYPMIKEGQILQETVFNMNDILNISFRVDSIGFLFAIISAVLWIFTIIYSFGYMKEYKNKNRYYTCLILSLGITMGVAFSGNLLTFYTFYELLTLITYPLVIHVQSPEAMEAGKKYLIYSFSGAGLILMAIMLNSFLVGNGLAFNANGIIDTNLIQEAPGSLELIFLLFVVGFSVKAAVMPLHRWLPQAMVAPTPVSALFHAVAVVNSGVFGIIRVIYFVFGWETVTLLMTAQIFLVFVLITIVLASVIALFQDNLKKRLAYSTISQLGYISLGALLLNEQGAIGASLHIFNHALMKITLFFCAGTIYIVTHKKNISEMAGIGKKMPWTMGAFAIASLGMVGIPPSVGFNSKWPLLLGSFNQGSILIMGLLLLSALLNAGYFFPIVITAFFKEPINEFEEHDGRFEAPISMLAPVVILAGATIVFGIWYQFPTSIVELFVNNIF